MRTLTLGTCLYLALMVLAPGPSSAADLWTVIAPENLDPRIVSQVKELASQNKAEVRLFKSAAEADPLEPRLRIELNPEENLDSFVQRLRTLATNAQGELRPELAQDGYSLQATFEYQVGLERATIIASTARGFHNGLIRLGDLLSLSPQGRLGNLIPAANGLAIEEMGRSSVVVLDDYPSFPERGIVEGFYGTPWSHQDRLDVLRFAGQHRMNVYYYAPKDDPYHRKLWREPYPPEQMKRLGELVDTARENFVDFCFAISPGLSMVYSNADDFAALTRKLDSVAKLGVSCFALFLDDVPQDLENSDDKARFKTLAGAHADLTNKLHEYLKSQSATNRLTLTPTTYTNEWGSRDYIRELGASVNPDVAIVWTGPEVVSPEITVGQAKEWGELLHRPPLVWDNFPVNDGISWRLNLGPLRGRDPNLPTAVRGLFSNPMNQARASLIPLQTVADYLWNSQAYDPERSHQKALSDQYGAGAAKALAPFLKAYGDYWWDDNIFRPLFVEERRVIDTAEIEQQITELESSLGPLRAEDRFRRLAAELALLPPKTRDRLSVVRAYEGFRKLSGQELQWREDYQELRASRARSPWKLDGNFAKCRKGKLYTLDHRSRLVQGGNHWRGFKSFSALACFAWDENYFYIGVDMTDSKIYQPFQGRGIDKGDAFVLNLETAFRKNFLRTRADGDEYRLFLSPGNFSRVGPSVFSDEDYLPLRTHPRDYERGIRTAWKKTRRGFSGDIAIPVEWFDGGKFSSGYEIGLSFGAQKVIPSKNSDEVQRIVFSSKLDKTFPVRFGNPSTYQRLVLAGSERSR